MMIPAGYMLKRIGPYDGPPQSTQVDDVYSVKSRQTPDFTDYIPYWRHNGWWFFDSVAVMRDLAQKASIDLGGTSLFYYECFELQFEEDIKAWRPFEADVFETRIELPRLSKIEGYDIVCFQMHANPDCSPLADMQIAGALTLNRHCLLDSFEEAKFLIEEGTFDRSEPGPYRIFAVFSVPFNL